MQTTRIMTSTCLLLGTVVLWGCAGFWPSQAAPKRTTLQVLSSVNGSEMAIVRTQGDRVLVFLLSGQPALDDLPEFLSRRGLPQIDELIVASPLSEAIHIPPDLQIRRIRSTPENTEILKNSLTGNSEHQPRSIDLVSASTELHIPGISVRLVPISCPDSPAEKILIDLRHSENRLILVPPGSIVSPDLAKVGLEDISLLGPLNDEALGALENEGALEHTDMLILNGGNDHVTANAQKFLLPPGTRLVFQSGEDGLLPMGTYDLGDG